MMKNETYCERMFNDTDKDLQEVFFKPGVVDRLIQDRIVGDLKAAQNRYKDEHCSCSPTKPCRFHTVRRVPQSSN
jgi:hypothetical protein